MKRIRRKFFTEEEFLEAAPTEPFYALDYSGERVRAGLYYDAATNKPSIFVFEKRKTKEGKWYSVDEFMAYFRIPKWNPEAQWKRRINGAIRRLESSGFNPDLLEAYKTIKKMGHKTALFILDRSADMTVDDMNDQKSYFFPFSDQYNIIGEDGTIRGAFTNPNVVDCNTIPTWFGSENAKIKSDIQDAIKNKKEFSAKVEANRDVSFSYCPEKGNMAVYSECFKRRQNGMHCLALDKDLAVLVLDSR